MALTGHFCQVRVYEIPCDVDGQLRWFILFGRIEISDKNCFRMPYLRVRTGGVTCKVRGCEFGAHLMIGTANRTCEV